MLSNVNINTLAFAEQIAVNVSGRVPFRLTHSDIRIGMGDTASGVPALGVNLTGLDPAGFTVGLPGSIGMNDIRTVGADVLATDGSIQARLIDIAADAAFGEARMELSFDTKPGTLVTLPFKSWGCQFWHQPYLQGGPDPFTGYEPGENPTDHEGPSRRAADVCGSYAVYDTLGNRKLMHIRRPRIFDGMGNEGLIPHPVFPGVPIPAVDLVITPTSFEFHIDPTWLASAPAPITIDPNLGYDSIGGTNGVNTIRVNCCQFTEGGSGNDYDTFFVYNGSDTTPIDIETAVYGDTAGIPDALIQSGPTITGATGWVSGAITTVTTSASDVIWMLWQGSNGAGGVDEHDPRYDASWTSETWNISTAYYSPWADPAARASVVTAARKYSVYLQPAAGGGLFIPVAMNHYRRLRAA